MTTSDDSGNSSSAGGCTPCGATTIGSSSIPTLELKRIHRSRYPHLTSSAFGYRNYLTYDKTLFFNRSNATIQYMDPGHKDHSIICSFDASRGGWANASNEHIFGIFLYNSNGDVITSESDRSTAVTAVLLHHDGTSEHYDVFWSDKTTTGNARLTSLRDRSGNAISFNYLDALPADHLILDGNLAKHHRRSSIADDHGRTMTFTWDVTAGHPVITSATLPNGSTINYTYGALGTYEPVVLTGVTHADGSQTTFTAVDKTALGISELTVVDPTAPAGFRHRVTTQTLRTGTDANGNTVTQSRNMLFTTRNGEGEYTYARRMVGGSRFVYNGGNKVRRKDFLSTGGVGEERKVSGDEWRSGFYSTDTTTWTADPYKTASYNSNTAIDSGTDPFGRQKTFVNAPISNSVLGSGYADGSNSARTINAFQQTLTSTDRLGRQSAKTYNVQGNLLSVTNAVGTAEETTRTNLYNTRGQLIEARDALYDPAFPELHNTKYEYDVNNFLVKKIESADVAGGSRPETSLTYDSAGRLATSTDPAGRTVTYNYDNRNRLIKITYFDGSYEETTFGSGDFANFITAKRDRNGNQTTFEYDKAGRLLKQTEAAGTPEAVETTYTYLEGTARTLSVTRHGETTTNLFDFDNRVVGSTVKVNAQTELTSSKEFDQKSRLRSTTDAYGRKTFFLYDQNDRIIKTVSETVPGGLVNVPAITADAQQTASSHVYSLTDKAGNTLETSNTHKVTYTCARDLFLEALTRDLDNNAAYLIRENVYDSEGQLLISTDSRGINSWTEYDGLGRTTLTIAAVGTNAEIRSETDYDDNSNVIATRSPRYFTEGAGASTPTLPNVGVENFTYNGRNLRKSHTTAVGSTIAATQSWTYYLDGRSDTHTDFRGNVAKTLWHACCGRLQGSIQRDGTSTTISNTDFYGNVTHTAVIKNFELGITDYHNPDDAKTLRETTTRFDSRNRPTHTTQWLVALGNVNDHARVNLGDTTGIPIAGLDGIPAANGLTTSYVYDDDLTDGTGIDSTYATQLAALTTRYGYNPFAAGADGSAVAVTNPAGETSVRINDAAGRTILTINPEGNIATMHYDAMENVVFPDPFTTNYSLLATKSIDANGNSSTSYSDAAGRTLASEDALGNRSYVAYDANSNTVLTRDPNGLGQSCTYDALNRDISCEDQQETAELASRTKIYNAASQVVSSSNAEGHITTAVFDERGRLVSTTDPNNITTSYTYDANNNLKSLTDGNSNTRSWTYDARNLKVQKTNPGGANGGDDVLSYSYDALGRLTIKTDQLTDTCEMFYDLAGRMVKKEYKYHGSTLESTDTFTYDAASRLTSSHKGRYNVTTNHSYAADSMPTAESFIIDGRTYNLARGYDAANRPVSHTFHDGKVKNWTYDARNLVKTLSYDGDLVVTNTHDAGYRLTHQIHANGLAREITYGRLDNLRTTDVVKDGLSTVGSLNLNYTYNVDKQVTAENTVASFLDDSSFVATYDAGDRLKTWTRAGNVATGARETEAWDYDNAGNQTKVTRDGDADNRTYNADNELTKTDNEETQVDAKGNMTEDDHGNKYTYDLDNRINKIEMNGGDTVEVQYDALGRRVLRTNGTDKTAILWWGDQEIAEHAATSGQATIQNDLWAHPTALNKIIARAVDGDRNKIEHYHKNYLEHIFAISDDEGDIKEHYGYSAFGEVEVYSPTGQKLEESAIGNTRTWNSRTYDWDTMLHYYKWRHYNPRLARWLGRDPIAEDGGINLYNFVGNEPIGRWDRLGMWWEDKDPDTNFRYEAFFTVYYECVCEDEVIEEGVYVTNLIVAFSNNAVGARLTVFTDFKTEMIEQAGKLCQEGETYRERFKTENGLFHNYVNRTIQYNDGRLGGAGWINPDKDEIFPLKPNEDLVLDDHEVQKLRDAGLFNEVFDNLPPRLQPSAPPHNRFP